MDFRPAYCPNCHRSSQTHPPFRWIRRGTFKRACDNRVVQHFHCRHCHKTFSEQSFRLDYRLKRPGLHYVLMRDFVSKTSHRQSARTLGCARKTVHHRLQLIGTHCREFHELVLERARDAGVRGWRFLLDELETHEERRRLQPVTVPVIVEHPSHFVVGTSVGTLPARGNLRPAERQRKAELELERGRRLNQSREAVREALQSLVLLQGGGFPTRVESDSKSSYPGLVRATLGGAASLRRHSSTARRDRANPLFPINHTLAMMRDGVSRLVRRNWGASKRRERRRDHLWIWIAWRNYVRGITVRAPRVTPAMALGVLSQQHSCWSLLTWRVRPHSGRAQPRSPVSA